MNAVVPRPAQRAGPARLRTLVVVAFLNEEGYLPTFLASICAQSRRPDLLVLVDDGSTDGSPAVAEGFARSHPWIRALRRPPRPPERDRLATAAELKAFHWGLEQVEADEWDVIVKMDGDLDLSPRHFETVLDALEGDPAVGIAGAYLSIVDADGCVARETHPDDHVRGPNKFFRRACLEQVEPLPAILGWDTIDERRARMHGWRTSSVALPSGDSIHLRPTGQHDGRLRAFRRWGYCAWGWGAHPLYVLAGAVHRFRRRPYVLGGISYLWGYLQGALTRAPQVDPETKAFGQREEKARLRNLLTAIDQQR